MLHLAFSRDNKFTSSTTPNLQLSEYFIVFTPNESLYLPPASCLVAAALADSTPENFELPSNASIILGGIQHGFE